MAVRTGRVSRDEGERSEGVEEIVDVSVLCEVEKDGGDAEFAIM